MAFRILLAGWWVCLLSSCSDHPSEPDAKPTAYWVWNRTDPLTLEELSQLTHAGVDTIYWQVAELGWNEGELHLLARWPLPQNTKEIGFLPVVRLDSGIKDPSAVDPEDLARHVQNAGAENSVQFDYDCPTRLLPAYARMIHAFRSSSGFADISCTALLSWADAGSLAELEAAVDAIFPMFYDAYPEKPQSSPRPTHAVSLIDHEDFQQDLRRWGERCSIPWHAGLPNFSRLSVFRDGEPRGHIRSWTTGVLLDNDAIRYDGEGEPGVSLFEVTSPTRIGNSSLRNGDWLALRQCSRDELVFSIEAVQRSNAESLVWYQMPRDELASSGWSVPALSQLLRPSSGGSGCLTLKGEQLTLNNCDVSDWPLSPRAPHSLTLSLPEPILREVKAGDFRSVRFLRDGREVPAFAATSLEFTFHQLRSGDSLSTGLFLLRKREKDLEARYRIDENPWVSFRIEP